MFSNLRAEMARRGIGVKELSLKIGISEKSLRNKLNGETAFTWPEAKAIRRIVNPLMDFETLFKSDDE